MQVQKKESSRKSGRALRIEKSWTLQDKMYYECLQCGRHMPVDCYDYNYCPYCSNPLTSYKEVTHNAKIH